MSKKTKTLNLSGLNFIPVGGCSSIGMNLYAYIYNDQWILVDMGMGFDNEFGKELLVPSPDILIKNKSKIKALFITHSHEDHIGAIPYLWDMVHCPIYARSFALEMIRDKIYQFDLNATVPLIKVKVKSPIEVGDFQVEFIPVAHSTPESSALAIKTPDGTVIHSGDWRIDNDPVLGSKTDEDRFKEIGDKGVTALVCDSTNVFREMQYGSEKEVRKNLIELAKQFKGHRVIVTCFASNLARLESCYMAAKESGRQLIIAGRSLKKIEKVAKLAGYFSTLPAFLTDKKIDSIDPEQSLIVCTGSQGERGSALSKIANGTHRYIKILPNDIVMFSSRVIPGNENSVIAIQNALISHGAKIITSVDHDIHASGHPSRAELERLYSLIKPKIVIPVHGEIIQLYKHAEIAKNFGIKNILIPKDGDIIKIDKGKAEVVGKIESQTLAVDGHQLIPITGTIYKQRETLSTSGIVSALIEYKSGSISLLEIRHSGVFDDSESHDIDDITSDIIAEINLSFERILRGKSSKKDIQTSIEKIIKTVFINNRGKAPMVFVHVIKK